MQHFRPNKFVAALFILFMAVGFTQAQFSTTLSGTVTAGDDSMAVENYKLWIALKNDTTQFRVPVFTDEDGFYSHPVATNQTYTISSIDSLMYEPVNVEVQVGAQPVTQDIHLTLRDDLQPVSGNVFFQGAGVETDIYFLKISDEVDLDDFREYEAYFNVPKFALKWASYHAMTDANGAFSLKMLDGQYVMYIPEDKEDGYLPHWGVLNVEGETFVDDINLVEMTTLSGTVTNTDNYDMVKVMAHSVSAQRPFMATPDSTGDYVIDVAPGDYMVRVVAYFDENMYMEFYTEDDTAAYIPKDADVVEVPQAGVSDINFDLPVAQVYDFSISGMVTSAQSGNPIGGAEVAFVSYNYMSNLYRAYDTKSGDDGMYSITGKTMLKEDSLVGFAAAENFFAEFYEDEATFLTADPIVYHADENVEGIDFALDTLDTEDAYSISGMVMDEEGNPVQQGQVTAYSTAVNIGVVTAEIDSNGHYAFDSVFPNGSNVVLQAWGGFGYLPSIYDGAESWKDATPVEINGADVQDINFTLKEVAPARLPIAKIKGLVDLGGSQLAKATDESQFEGATVYVRSAEDANANWSAVDQVDENGKFDLGVDSDGLYEVKFTSPDPTIEDVTQTVEVDNLEGEVKLTPATAIDEPSNNVIQSHQLHEAYPNPFNPSTTIQVDMARPADASLVIYNVLGQKVRTLHNGYLNKGVNTFTWNGKDEAGNSVSSGLYFYQLQADEVIQTKAVMFLK
ncbi:MAG: T9SS type A sorting domain-containing protein [Caldithrix sp.]|nr:T9SS type A sorting domain-containing protein [Caldithrix sp.]